MTIQRRRRFLPFALGQRTACRSFTFLMLLALVVIGLPALSGAQQTCQPDGDVDQSGSVTAADALLAFQQALSLAELDMCQQSIADVFPLPATPDGNITASDALCIFQRALSLPPASSPSSQGPPMRTVTWWCHVQRTAAPALSPSNRTAPRAMTRPAACPSSSFQSLKNSLPCHCSLPLMPPKLRLSISKVPCTSAPMLHHLPIS